MTVPLFLSLDGLDGTGKSTQTRLLVDRLRGADVTVTACADPGGTPLGAKVRELLLHGRATRIDPRAEAALFMASRAQLVDEVIRPALVRGEVVVCDRFLLSTVVYQGHGRIDAGRLGPDVLWDVGTTFTDGLLPDLTLVFDLPPDEAVRRRGRSPDRMESRDGDYFRSVRQGFLAEARRLADTHVILDASPPTDTVHTAVWAAVSPLLRARGHLTDV
ncbi:MAG TPA: dTMP kinase [Fimbriiglobus sp.]|jgi:dTMP kinase|nr:dTMP kinase [Fimbriiglobus sp.]